jgi:hypothetical protein
MVALAVYLIHSIAAIPRVSRVRLRQDDRSCRRLAYPAVSNAFAALQLSPMVDREKDIEILTLRHQISVLQRQLGATRPDSIQQIGRLSPPCPHHRRATHCGAYS